MYLAVISDIHANREALDAVIDSIRKRSVDKIICLGDIVNYGIDFGYCIDVVRERSSVCLLGNHDSTVVGRDPLWSMNLEAQKSALWTMDHLSMDQRIYIENLDLTYSENNMLFVHGSPGVPDKWDYITNWFDAENQFDNFQENFCFVGHSHVPAIYDQQDRELFYNEDIISLSSDHKFIINVGSVGQPRDGDPRACYVIVDNKIGTIEFIRVIYDVEEASRKIASTGVSDFNAQRILVGI